MSTSQNKAVQQHTGSSGKLAKRALLVLLSVLAIFGIIYLAEAAGNSGLATAPSKTTAEKATTSTKELLVPDSTDLLTGDALLAELKKGGLVLYTRHFHTDHRKWSEDPIKPDHLEMTEEDFKSTCDRQRPLTDYGRMRARLAGESFNKLGVPIGNVYSSPYCRAIECATLMAGREPDATPKDLVHRGGKLTAEMMISNIRPYLSEIPTSGTNTLLVAHRPQMDDIHFIDEGQTFIFRPKGNGKFDMIGSIYDTDWTEALVDIRLLGARYVMATLQGADIVGTSEAPKKVPGI